MSSLSFALSAAMLGIDGYIVRVEADSSPGTPAFAIIGLPDRALGEARERVRSAIFNCGFAYPAGRLLINLSPADIRKEGPAFDLPIALALLAIDEQVDRLALSEFVTLGELALDGAVRAARGIYSVAACYPTTPASSRRGRFARRTTLSARSRSPAGAFCRSRERSASRTTACCSSTRSRNSAAPRSRSCATCWETAP